MAEETSVFGRVVFRQGSFSVWGVALAAELFSFFFIHLHESGMVFIVWEMLCCFFRRVPEKKKKANANNNKNKVVDDDIFSF